MNKIGSRAQVFHGTALMTGGGLRKQNFFKDKYGRIKSVKASKASKPHIKGKKNKTIKLQTGGKKLITKTHQVGGKKFFSIPQNGGGHSKTALNSKCNCKNSHGLNHKLKDHVENSKSAFKYPLKDHPLLFQIPQNGGGFTQIQLSKKCNCIYSSSMDHKIKDHMKGGGFGSMFGKMAKGFGSLAKKVGSKMGQMGKRMAQKGLALGKRMAVKGVALAKRGAQRGMMKARQGFQKLKQARQGMRQGAHGEVMNQMGMQQPLMGQQMAQPMMAQQMPQQMVAQQPMMGPQMAQQPMMGPQMAQQPMVAQPQYMGGKKSEQMAEIPQLQSINDQFAPMMQ